MNAFDILALCQKFTEADDRCLYYRSNTVEWTKAHRDLMDASDAIIAATKQYNAEQEAGK